MKGLKNLDFKKFFVDHGEKIGLGVAVAIGLAVIALSRWSTYDKHPQDFVTKAEVAERDMAPAVNPWPEGEKTKYASARDISSDARKLRVDMDLAKFSYPATQPGFVWPVIAPSKPIGEPTLFPVSQMIATSGSGIFAVASAIDPATLAAGALGEDGLPADPTGAAGPRGAARGRNNRPDEPASLPGDLDSILPSTPMGPGGANGLGGPGAPGMAHGSGLGGSGLGGSGLGGSPRMAGPGMAGPGMGSHAAGGMGSHGETGSGEMGYGSGAASAFDGEPRRYVSVRGVFPIRDQLKELADVLNLPSASAASDQLIFTDFELERQTAVPGDDPWAGEWTPVDKEVALDMLGKVINFDMDEVDVSVMDPVFTMPLPARVPGVGTWGKSATHPALASYELTEEGKRKQEFLLAEFAKYAAQAEEARKSTIQPGGFANQVVNLNKGREALEKDREKNGLNPQLLRAAKELGMSEAEVSSMISAGGSFALFRYIDYDVQPGTAYRYKVRLKVVNPSYGKPLDEVARADVAEGLHRETPWSEPTPPVVVARDNYFYLTDVKSTARLPDKATFDVYEWSSKHGTFVNSLLEVEPGQFIGGTLKTEVLDPAEQTFDQQEYEFRTDDVVADIDNSPSGLYSVRPELGLSRRNELPRQVLLVDGQGDLRVVDPVSREAERQAWARRQKLVADAYAYLKQKTAEPAGYGMEGGHGSSEMGSGGEGSGAMMPGGGRGRRGQSPLRRGGSGRGPAGMVPPGV